MAKSSETDPYLALNAEVDPYLAQNDTEDPYLALNKQGMEIPLNVPPSGTMMPSREMMGRAGESLGKMFDTVLPEIPQEVVNKLPDGQAGWAPSAKGSAELYNKLRSGQPIIPPNAVSELPQWVQESLKNTSMFPVTGLGGQINPGAGVSQKSAAGIGIGTTNAAAMAVPFLTSPGGAATLAAPAVIGPMVAAGFAAEAIPQLPDVGARIGQFINPGPKPSEFQRPTGGELDEHAKLLDPNDPNLAELTAETVGTFLMSAGAIPAISAAAGGVGKLKANKLATVAAEKEALQVQALAERARIDAETARMDAAKLAQEEAVKVELEKARVAEQAREAMTPPPSTLATEIDRSMGIAQPTSPAARSAEVLMADPARQAAADIARGLESREAIASAQQGNMQRAIAGRQGAAPEVQPNPAEVQRQAFEKPYAPTDPVAPELPPLSAQAQRMMDEYGVKAKTPDFSIAEPALGALSGNILGELVDADDDTKAKMMAAGFVLGHFGNQLVMRKLMAQKPGMSVVSGQMSSQMSGKVDVPKFDKLKDAVRYVEAYARENPVIPKGTRLATPKGREAAVQAIVEHTLAELEAHASTKPNDRSFYTTDITQFTNPAIQKLAQERYGRQLTDAEIKLTHVLSALGSGESTPTTDTGYGLRVFDEYMRTGRPTGHSEKPKPIYRVPAVGQDPLQVFVDSKTGQDTFVAKGNEPKYAPLAKAKISKTYNTSAVSRLNEIVDYFDGNMDAAMDWLGSRHTFPEIEKVIGKEAAKALKPHEYLDKSGESFGVFALGNNPKLGSYILNRWQNLDTITKDLWVARTMSRYFNEKNTGTPWATTKEGMYKRQMLDEAWGKVADKLGIKPAEVQERMWAAERDLYERMGMPKGSSYTSEGVGQVKLAPFSEKPENIGRSGVMASPSVEDIQYPAAVEKLKSPEQENFRGLATKHAPGARIYDAIGDWLDGAENSLFLVFDKIQTPSKLKEIGARLGEAREQKAILWWHQDPAGTAALHEVTWPKGVDMKQARQILIDAGIENRTIINTPEGVKALIFDMDQSLVDRINKVKANELFPPTINSVPATGEFLGAATRPEAVRTYRDVLGQIESRRSERGQAVGRSDVGLASADPAVRGAVNTKVLQTLAGGVGGFAYGYAKGKDLPPEERLGNALAWSVFGGALASPLRGAAVKAIRNVKIPVPAALRPELAGAENFYLFQRGMLQEAYDALKTKSSEIAATAATPLRNFNALDKLMPGATAGDRLAVNSYLMGKTSSGNIINPDLKLAAEKLRGSIDDLSNEWMSLGVVKSGSDLQHTITNNLGEYLTRSYELFENPEFKPDPVKIQKFKDEYVRDELLNGSTVPIPELQQQGYEAALRILAKSKGGALDSAAQFVLGEGIARSNGSIFKPRKELSDATRELMGEIKDPLKMAGLTIDRMSHYMGAVKMQQNLREAGLKLGLFSDKATPEYTVPMVSKGEAIVPDPITGVVLRPEIADKLKSKGPLSDLWTRPEVADALRSYEAYQQSGLLWRTINTVGAMSKMAKTAGNLESYPPNFWSSWATLLGQGSGVHMVMHAKAAVPTFQVLFDDVLPTSKPKIAKDVEFLVRERLLNQNVNLNDLVDGIRQSLVPSASGKMSAMIPSVITQTGKKLGGAVLNAYGKAEAIPRILGFYLEVARYRKALPGLTEAEIYQRAAERTRGVYPNSSELPDAVKKLSATGALNPFIAWQYETFWRNPYNTMRFAKEDIMEGLATKNPLLVAEGALRASSFVGMVLGALAINEQFSQRSGVSPRQEEAIKRTVPEYDKDGLLVITDLNPASVAYANQSYIMPHSLPAAAVKAALDGVSPLDAAMLGSEQLIAAAAPFGGSTWITPLKEAITGKNTFGRDLFPKDAGPFVDTSSIQSRPLQDLSIGAQTFLQRSGYFLNRAYTPGTVNTAVKWKKMAYDEVGPDGQLYDPKDLASRLVGLRVNRLDIPMQYERRASGLGDRLKLAHQDVNRLTERKDTKPDDLEFAYRMQETARKRILGDIRTYIDDGMEMLQPREKLIENLGKRGVSADLILGAINGYYVPGRKGKDPTLEERLAAVEELPQAQKDAAWNQLIASDLVTAKAMRGLKESKEKEAALGVTPEDKLFLGMSITDGSRARNVARHLIFKSGDNLKAMEPLYRQMEDKRIITPEVQYQLDNPKVWSEARASLKAGLAPKP